MLGLIIEPLLEVGIALYLAIVFSNYYITVEINASKGLTQLENGFIYDSELNHLEKFYLQQH